MGPKLYKMADMWVDVAAGPESTCQAQGKSSGVEEKSKFSSYKRRRQVSEDSEQRHEGPCVLLAYGLTCPSLLVAC